jgi:hypothetical protein
MTISLVEEHATQQRASRDLASQSSQVELRVTIGPRGLETRARKLARSSTNDGAAADRLIASQLA